MLCGVVIPDHADIGQGGNTVEKLALIVNKRRHCFSSSRERSYAGASRKAALSRRGILAIEEVDP
jgi:hypothetical protein